MVAEYEDAIWVILKRTRKNARMKRKIMVFKKERKKRKRDEYVLARKKYKK